MAVGREKKLNLSWFTLGFLYAITRQNIYCVDEYVLEVVESIVSFGQKMASCSIIYSLCPKLS